MLREMLTSRYRFVDFDGQQARKLADGLQAISTSTPPEGAVEPLLSAIVSGLLLRPELRHTRLILTQAIPAAARAFRALSDSGGSAMAQQAVVRYIATARASRKAKFCDDLCLLAHYNFVYSKLGEYPKSRREDRSVHREILQSMHDFLRCRECQHPTTDAPSDRTIEAWSSGKSLSRSTVAEAVVAHYHNMGRRVLHQRLAVASQTRIARFVGGAVEHFERSIPPEQIASALRRSAGRHPAAQRKKAERARRRQR